MKFRFWKTEKRDEEPTPKDNLEIAIDLLTQIQHKSPDSQRDIVTKLFHQVFDDSHIHLNPRKRTQDMAT